jgi:hypothetical protein
MVYAYGHGVITKSKSRLLTVFLAAIAAVLISMGVFSTVFAAAVLSDSTPPAVPAHTSPLNNSFKTTAAQTLIDWQTVTDPSEPVTYRYQSSHSSALNLDDSFISSAYSSGVLAESQIPTPNTPEGVYYWHVKAVDNLGNESAWSTAWKFTVDNTVPSAPTLISPADNAFVNGAVLTNQWSSVSDATKYVYESYNDAGATSLRWHQEFTGTSKTATNVADAVFWWRVKAVDAAGNESGWSTLWKITVDNTNPTANLVFGGTGLTVKSFNVVFNENVKQPEAENPANYFLNNWPGESSFNDANGLSGHVTITYNPVNFTSTINFTDSGWYVLPEQQWGVRGIHDLAGNALSPSPVAAYSTPMVAPVTVANLSGTVGTNGFYMSGVTVNLSATDPAVGSDVKATYYNLDGAGYVQGNSVVATADGSHSLCYYSIDNAGNTESTKCDVSFKIDKTAPVVDITSPTGTLLKGTVEIRGTVMDANPHHYWFVVDGAGGNVNLSPYHTGTINDTNSFTDELLALWDTTKVPDGTYTIKLEARDAANNKDAGSKVWLTVTVDNNAPIITLLGDNPLIIEVGSSTFVDPGSTVTDDIDSVLSATTTNDIDLTKVGTYSILYDAQDSAGNIATQKIRAVNVVDTQKPEIKMNGTDETIMAGDSYVDQGAIVIDNYDGVIPPVVTSNVDTTTPGDYTVVYNATDSSGNIADPVTRKVTVNAAPSFTFASITAPTNLGAITRVLGAAVTGGTPNQPTDTAATSVLGAEETAPVTSNNPASEVKGVATAANKGNIFGQWWFWLIVVLVIAGLLVWYLLARRKNAD